jgi:hypothetical protein
MADLASLAKEMERAPQKLILPFCPAFMWDDADTTFYSRLEAVLQLDISCDLVEKRQSSLFAFSESPL